MLALSCCCPHQKVDKRGGLVASIACLPTLESSTCRGDLRRSGTLSPHASRLIRTGGRFGAGFQQHSMLSAPAKGPGAPEWSMATDEETAVSIDLAAAHVRVSPHTKALRNHFRTLPAYLEHLLPGAVFSGQVGIAVQRLLRCAQPVVTSPHGLAQKASARGCAGVSSKRVARAG